MAASESELLIHFFLGTGTDHRGRSLMQIVEKPDQWLERTHDYIQWIFPLYIPSRFNPFAPVLTEQVHEAFNHRDDPNQATLQRNFEAAICRMLQFYGYDFDTATNTVSTTEQWWEKSDNWLTEDNHNFLRITRMLRSMFLLGRHEAARSFHGCLLAAARIHPFIITKRTLDFWDEAVSTQPSGE